MPESPRPAVIFDFGNVVAFFDYRIACARLGRPLGLSGEDFLERARGRGLTPVLTAYERGDISSRQFSETVCRLTGLTIAHDDFAAAWADIFRPNEPVIALARDLRRRGHRLVLGSNTNEIHARHFRRQFAEALAVFDRLVLSYEVRHVKPAPGFYHACAEAASAPPSGCLFVDDMPENVEGARAAGLPALLYRDPPSLLAGLHALGIETDPPAFEPRPAGFGPGGIPNSRPTV